MNSTIFSDLDMKNKRVFLRVDLNVPLAEKSIHDDFRIQTIIPTIDSILKRGGKVILATHIGRPTKFNRYFSNKKIASWFTEHGYKIKLENDLVKAEEESHKDFEEILLLENLRFFPGEQSHDKQFALTLSKLADYYVNDAFALSHRTDASVALLPTLFPQDKRALGPLMKKELSELDKLNNPDHPFVIMIGGAKIKSKLPLIKHFLNKADYILILPPLSFTFMAAKNISIGSSLVNYDAKKDVNEILTLAEKSSTKIIFPNDYIVSENRFHPPFSIIKENEFKNEHTGINIGPETILNFKPILENAKTIFVNGLPGILNKPETLNYSKNLLELLEESKAYTIIGGGESIAIVHKFKFENKFDFLSTGGGAALAYISGKSLPGINWAK